MRSVTDWECHGSAWGYLTSKMFCLLSFLVICFACKMQHAQEGQEPLQEGLLQVGRDLIFHELKTWNRLFQAQFVVFLSDKLANLAAVVSYSSIAALQSLDCIRLLVWHLRTGFTFNTMLWPTGNGRRKEFLTQVANHSHILTPSIRMQACTRSARMKCIVEDLMIRTPFHRASHTHFRFLH